jgi:hypothetical protein
MNINWNLVEEKYPELFSKIIKWFCGLDDDKNWDDLDKLSFENYCCYCYIEKFFRENGIIIDIFYNQIDRKLISGNYTFQIHIIKSKVKHKIYTNKDAYNICDEAKEQAVLKSFEIMEGQTK